ncbi:hypothetical protein ENSA5_61950 [Enhygromyxa salina]|uniref:Uncharacterized protein n=1 Tax=Enhygromyxa salina TaxID=215803 RepID=A0A2S9XDK0_9BACT|nr:hypothetical protein [Enhygromyxa salina]PRP90761.1 hypothetical protein ENSA5_61950 [Enhygromyxa salina]
MVEVDIEGILTELDEAYKDLKAARTRLAELLPMSATRPGDSGQARVEFVTGLDPEAGNETSGEELIRQINAEAWEHAQKALLNATEMVELAHKHLRRELER